MSNIISDSASSLPQHTGNMHDLIFLHIQLHIKHVNTEQEIDSPTTERVRIKFLM